jgi:hypothetical protein
VDKRISARGPDEPAPEPKATVEAPIPAEPVAPEPVPSDIGERHPSEVWTPEQEAEARRIAQEIAETPSLDWVINTAVTLANVAATKMELGDPADAGLAIDALGAMVNSLSGKLADAEAPLRQTLAQLQMAYAERSMNPPPQNP